MLFEPFDVSRILETWKFPVRFLHGERLERLERSEAVERLEQLERTDPVLNGAKRLNPSIELRAGVWNAWN
jgi:hypothetical protein